MVLEGSSYRPILTVTGVYNITVEQLRIQTLESDKLRFKSLHLHLLAVLLGQVAEEVLASVSSSTKQGQ